MDLGRLQSKGAIHIGWKSSRTVLYAYILDAYPGRIALGWTHAAVSQPKVQASKDEAGPRASEGPVIEEILSRTGGQARFLMICHHSSSKEIMGKIHAALSVKGMASTAPEEAGISEQEVWLSAGLEDVVFAYPPFAKIFLSEVPTFAEERQSELEAEEQKAGSPEAGPAGACASAGPKAGAGQEQEDGKRRNGLKDILFLRSKGARSTVSLFLLLGIIFGAAFLMLERLRSTEEGRDWLFSIEQMTGFSFGTEEGRGVGFLTRAELERRRLERSQKEAFTKWYDPARTDDAGSTFGMPREYQGFYIKTWVDGRKGGGNLYAAYRLNPETAWQGEAPDQVQEFQNTIRDRLDVQKMEQVLLREACSVQSGKASSLYADGFRKVEVLIVYDQDILAAFSATQESCEKSPQPDRRQ